MRSLEKSRGGCRIGAALPSESCLEHLSPKEILDSVRRLSSMLTQTEQGWDFEGPAPYLQGSEADGGSRPAKT